MHFPLLRFPSLHLSLHFWKSPFLGAFYHLRVNEQVKRRQVSVFA